MQSLVVRVKVVRVDLRVNLKLKNLLQPKSRDLHPPNLKKKLHSQRRKNK